MALWDSDDEAPATTAAPQAALASNASAGNAAAAKAPPAARKRAGVAAAKAPAPAKAPAAKRARAGSGSGKGDGGKARQPAMRQTTLQVRAAQLRMHEAYGFASRSAQAPTKFINHQLSMQCCWWGVVAAWSKGRRGVRLLGSACIFSRGHGMAGICACS